MIYCVDVDHDNAGSVRNIFYALGTANKMAL